MRETLRVDLFRSVRLDTKVLEGQRLRLRPVRADDIDLLFDWYSHPEIMALYDGIQFTTSDRAIFREEFSQWLDVDREMGFAGAYILELKEDGRPIGECTWIMIQRTGPESPGIYQVGGMIGPKDLRGKGLGTEALKVLRDHLFGERDAHRLEALTGAFNTGAMKTLHHNGFEREGVLRETLFVDGAWHDRVVFGLLKSEWENRKS